MTHPKPTRRYPHAWAAIVLATMSGVALAQSPTEGMSKVTKDYTIDFLLPGIPAAEADQAKQIGTWWAELGNRSEKRAAEFDAALSSRTKAKKAEIEALEARIKVAKSTSDDAQKAELAKALQQQKLELEILDAIEDAGKTSGTIANEWKATGKALQQFAAAYQDLAAAREKLQQGHAEAVEKAKAAGLPEPPPPFSADPYEKALKSYVEVGDSLQDLGSRMKSQAKARLAIVDAWKKRAESEYK